MSKKKIYYNLQICRGIAAIIVLIAHTNLILNKELFSGFFITGWNGVDFFFVLSGFIIFYVNAEYLGNSMFLKNYLLKRVIRIFPIYWLYTLVVIIIHFIISYFTGKHLISWIELNCSGIVKSIFLYPTNVTVNERPIIPVAWTLSFELFFYIIFGFCILINKRLYLYITLLWVVGILLNLFRIVNIEQSPFINTILNSRNIEFLYGCIIAAFALNHKVVFKPIISFSILFGGIFLLSVAWANEAFNLQLFPKFDFINFGLPYAIIIYASMILETSKVTTNFKKILVFFGDASYSIYLTHFILILLLKPILNKFISNDYISFFSMISLLLIFGCCSYQLIEKPVLKFCTAFFFKNKK